MSKYQPDRRSEVKPFQLVKYFATASFLILILFSIPFATFISQRAKDILLKSFEDSSIVVGENLNNLVYHYFVLPVMNTYGEIHLCNRDQQALLDNVVKNAIQGLNIELVKLYSVDQGIVVYSTAPALLKEKVVETPEYKKAVASEYSSEIISEGGLKKIKTYIPFTITLTSTGEEYVPGVFEATQNITKQYNSIVKLQLLIFVVSLLIMALIFFALLFVVHNAEKIIKKRAAEQRDLEEQLYLAERLAALGEMVAGVSHEIKNPLGIIQSTSELLTSMPNADEKQKRLSSVITEESIRLNRIVTDFLDFARPHKLNLNECHIEEVIRKNISFFKPELEGKGIVMYDKMNGRSFKLQADDDLLYRALMNIFLNSIQAIENAGSISVNVDEEKGGYRIEIEDTGIGISKENMKKIFNPFFTTKDKGTGLGLPIVRKIIEGHQGTIDVESQEGSGTKVIIHLPKKQLAT
ncbi:MAG TPA: ATP-binding protein [Desulfatiglandales bacterium]|nr:ATP-binding protein [Desulfatiglandales bacterium]